MNTVASCWTIIKFSTNGIIQADFICHILTSSYFTFVDLLGDADVNVVTVSNCCIS